MSIQDEKFPYDDLELSPKPSKRMVFPHPRSQRSKEELTSEQDNSRESSNSFPPDSETSRKTNASEPTINHETETEPEPESKKPEYERKNNSKAISYQDIHSEYTKRRYKHVESKVGQYIANIKALDEKRRTFGKFHRSMPETLSGLGVAESVGVGILRRSANDLDHMREQDSHRDNKTDTYDNLTATTSSSQDVGQDTGIILDRQTYEKLLSAKNHYEYLQTQLQEKNEQWLSTKDRYEYFQTQLHEKNAENWRLKRNLETMRIEYTLCKDKLKQLNQTHRLSGSLVNTSVGILKRNSLQCLLYPQETAEQATQTENILTPSPLQPLVTEMDMIASLMTPESNNNSFDHAAVGILAPAPVKVVHKTVATIQPLALNFSAIGEQDHSNDYSINNTMGFFRRRSNSISACKKSTPHPETHKNTSKASTSSTSAPSSDSAIDIEVLDSPRNERQSRPTVYMAKNGQRYAALDPQNVSSSFSETAINCLPATSTTTSVDCRPKKNRNRKNLSSRIKRFFGVCTKCEEANLSIDSGNNQQQSFSQIPLLEKSTTNPSQNRC